jgi:hypothetical protein
MIKRTTVLFSLAALVTLGSASVAQAQVANPVKFTVFGGASLPVGDSQDAIKTGYTVGGALDFHAPATPLGVRGELSYSGFDAKVGSGTLKDVGLNGNAVWWLSNPTPTKPYLTGGLSWSHQSVEGFDGVNAWGFNLGGGLQFALGELGTRLDVRYRRLSKDGDSFSVIPITFGITF